MVIRLSSPRAWLGLVAAALGLLLSIATAGAAQPPASILIWPVDPVIPADTRAATLWLENSGKAPVTLQVRIFAWAQTEAGNVYAPQDGVIGTPPLVTIQPGQKQLVRLTRTVPPPVSGEAAYRVIVDEIPTREAPAAAGAAVNFRMRYSLPLFVRGPDIAAGAKQARSAQPAPRLEWRVGTDAKGRFLEVRNRGAIHARLVDVAFAGDDEKRIPITPGLLGYVLPASTTRWPLPADLPASGDLVASINGAEQQIVARLSE